MLTLQNVRALIVIVKKERSQLSVYRHRQRYPIVALGIARVYIFSNSRCFEDVEVSSYACDASFASNCLFWSSAKYCHNAADGIFLDAAQTCRQQGVNQHQRSRPQFLQLHVR